MSGATWRRSDERPPEADGRSVAMRGVVVRAARDWTATRGCAVSRRRDLSAAPGAGRAVHEDLRSLSSEVVLEPDVDPVPRLSAVNLDSVESVSIGVLVERLGRLSDDRMRQICEALEVAVDCGK